MRAFLTITIVAITSMLLAQPLVRVDFDDFSKVARFYNFDVAYVREGAYVDIIGWEDDLVELLNCGVSYRIIIDDLPEYYASRLDLSLPMGGYPTLSEILATIDTLHTMFPSLVSVKESLATGWMGNVVYAIKISDSVSVDEDEPEVLYDATIHAREVITPLSLLHFINFLLNGYGTDPIATYLVNNRELWFILVLNPDGYRINEMLRPGGGGMWRKNARDNNLNGAFDTDYDGVDLNRNFNAHWGDSTGASPNPASPTYFGPAPFSEPESRGFKDFVLSHNFRTHINFHSFGNLYLFPWGYTRSLCPDHNYFMLYTSWMAERNLYINGNSSATIYITTGDEVDWMYDSCGIFSIAPEVGGWRDGFWPDTSRISYLCQTQLMPQIINALIAGYAPRAVDFQVSVVSGDGDSFPDVGELVELTVKIVNYGLDTATDFDVLVRPISSGILLVDSVEHFSAELNPKGDTAWIGGIRFSLIPPLSPGQWARFVLIVKDDQGYFLPDTFSFLVGTPVPIYTEDFDDTLVGWSLDGDWEVGPTSIPEPISPPNLLATRLAYGYSDSMLSMAVTPVFYIADSLYRPTMMFWHWYSIEGRGDDWFDGAQVRVKTTDDSTWSIITPTTSYPGNILPTNPFLGGRPGFCGRKRKWELLTFDLSSFRGDSVQFAFLLGTDRYVSYRGWYIDNFAVVDFAPETTKAVEFSSILPKISLAVYPNPFNSHCVITLKGNADRDVPIEIFDVAGKSVGKLVIPKGASSILWSPGDLPSGIYFVRTLVHDLLITRRVVMVR